MIVDGSARAVADRERPRRSWPRRALASAFRRPVPVSPLLALAGGLLLAAAFAPGGIWPLAPLGPAFLALALSDRPLSRRPPGGRQPPGSQPPASQSPGNHAPGSQPPASQSPGNQAPGNRPLGSRPLSRRSLGGSFGIGLVFGVAFFFPLLSWVLNVAWYAWLALAAAEAVIFGLLAVGQRLILGLKAWPLGVAGWWVAAEAVRDRWPWGGFPWGRLAMSQAGTPAQGWAAIGGAPLLTFVVALTGTTLAWLLLSLRGTPTRETPQPGTPTRGTSRPGTARRKRITATLAFAASIGVAAGPAAFTLDPVGTNDKTAQVAAVQGNVPRQRTLAAQLNDMMVTANHDRATLKLAQAVRAGKTPRPDLVIWPENSTDIDPRYDPEVYGEITQATDLIGAPVLVGAVLTDPLRNAGQLWLPGVGPSQVYLKRQLVPFGEVIPFRSLLEKITPLTRLQPVNFTPGHANTVFRIGKDIRLGDVICYEVGFDNLVRSEVTAGANLLTMQTNDADFERDGQTGETGQQLAMARLRAVEHDRAVVVASTTGYSAIIGPDGDLLEESGTWRQAVLTRRLPLVGSTTLADRVGAWPEYVIVILTAAAVAASIVISVNPHRPAKAQ